MNKKSTMIRGCHFGITVAMATLLGLVSGCIGLKTGPREVKRIPQKTELVSYSILQDNGITAKISFQNGNASLSMWWWPKVSQKFRTYIDEQTLVYGTTRIGFFPGVNANELMTHEPVLGTFWCVLSNISYILIPTIGSTVIEPFLGYGDKYRTDHYQFSSDICAWGLFGCYKYQDTKKPKLIWSDEKTEDAEEVRRMSLAVANFEVEVKGRSFKGDGGVAYLGSLVQPGDVVTIKIKSITPPNGYSIEDIEQHIGSQIELKTPTWSDLARSDEAAAARHAAAQAAEAKAQQVAAEAAAQDAARQAAALDAVTSAIQGMNATAMAISASTPSRVVTPKYTTSTVTTPTASTPRICGWCQGQLKCRTCNGLGRIEAVENIAHGSSSPVQRAMAASRTKCRACNGTGRCPVCHGTGRK